MVMDANDGSHVATIQVGHGAVDSTKFSPGMLYSQAIFLESTGQLQSVLSVVVSKRSG